jgi:myo-inositol-1(or 4)-monophosphatase
MEASADPPDWLAACRAIAVGCARCWRRSPEHAPSAPWNVGRGEGGDRTLVIDQAAEELIFAELERLHAPAHRFVAISEERGEVDFGGGRCAS